MSYQVIARKWRPQTFEEVTGQEPITRTLRNAVEHERLHHAYLFSGARGVGKTTTARLLAKALNCHKSDRPTTSPCKTTDEDACPSCREIAEGRSIDVLEIDAASNRGIDHVRDSIINTVGVRPARDRYKIFIIDEVHMLTPESFNALLKTLEEPPERVTFIMATTEAHKVPDTILSRVQQFEFRTIATKKIEERLRLIAETEKIEIEADALHEIARAGEGSMRDAQSAFDQVISFATNETITTEDVETALGLASTEMLARIVRAIAEEKPTDVLQVVEELAMRGHDFRNFCRDLLAYLRDLLVAKVGGVESDAGSESDARREMQNFTGAFSESDLVRFFHSLTETEKNLPASAHPRYQLEIGLVKLVEMRRLVSLASIAERLGRLEDALRNGTASPAGNTNAPPASSPTSTPNTPPPRTSSNRAFQQSNSRASEAGAPDFIAPQKASDGAGTTTSSDKIESQITSKKPVTEFEPSTLSDNFFSNSSSPTQSAHALKLVSTSTASPPQDVVAARDSHATEVSAYSANPKQDTLGKPSFSEQGVEPSENIAERIKAMLEERRRPFLAIALDGARQIRFIKDELCIDYAPEAKHLRDNLAKPESVHLLRDICREIRGCDTGVRISIRDANEADSKDETNDAAHISPQQPSYEQAELRAIAEKNPAVKQMLRTFRAEIVEVRRLNPNEH